MDSGLVLSSHYCSVTTGSTKNIHYARSSAIKGSQHKRKSHMGYNVLRFQGSILKQHHKFIERESTHQVINRNYVAKAVPKPSFDSEPHASDPKNILDSVKNFLAALYKFSYPYTMIGLTIGITSASFLAVEKLSDISPLFFIGVLQAVVPHLLLVMYINGVNQLFDFNIDKMNKPYLPLASGELSIKAVGIIAASFLTLSSLSIWIIGSWPLIWRHVSIFLLWTAYSIDVPLLRWKRDPLLTIMIMVVSSAFVVPIASFLHMQTFVLKRPTVFPRSLIVVIVFMTLYSVGIMMAKDITDVEGDKTYGIDTFAVRWGQKRVLWICVFLFEMAFGVAILAGAASSHLWTKTIAVLGHLVLASVLWYKAKHVDLEDKSSTGSFYMLIWKLLCVAYFLMPLIK